MSTLHIPPNLDLHYVVDDYTDPWRTPGTILLLHGNAESSAAWYGWVPQLAPRYRVVRPDMRGFGASTPMPRDFPWTLDLLLDDFCRLMDTLGVERFHLVGAKIGGTIARAFAARRPARVRTLTVVGTPTPYRVGAEERAPALMRGVRAARASHAGPGRAWPAASGARFRRRAWPGGRTSWAGRPSRPRSVSCLPLPVPTSAPIFPKIACPTLVITTEGSGLASVDETRAWQQTIPDAELLVLPGDSYHVAASDAVQCAQATLAFLARRDPDR